MNPGRTGDADAAAAFEAGIGVKKKKCRGGRRKSLKRLNSAKEIGIIPLTQVSD